MKLGPLEIGLIVGMIVLLFGVGKIADLGKNLGKSIGNFRREVRQAKAEGEEDESVVQTIQSVRKEIKQDISEIKNNIVG